MKDSQEFKKTKIMPIKTIEQIVASHLISEIILDIRKEIEDKNSENLEFVAPKLESKNKISQRAKDLFLRAFEIMKFKPSYVYMAKLGIEDIYNYEFYNNSSVSTAGSADTIHLQRMFNTRFVDLASITLEDHTLNVFEEAIELAESSGRASSMSLAILGALFHDFGKSSEIRSIVSGGKGVQRGVKAHAEVSFLYLQDLLFPRVYNVIEDSYSLTESTDRLAEIVKSHHPANNAQKEDLEIKFIVEADHKARRKEMKSIRSK